MTTNRTPATAADFEPYVAEARAGRTTLTCEEAAQVILDYARQARPDHESFIHGPFNFGRWQFAFPLEDESGIYVDFDDGWDEQQIAETSEDAETICLEGLESILAWLANQLAERCPVGAIRDSRDERAADGAPFRRDAPVIVRELWFHLSGEHFGDAEHAASAARLRRMFGIGEPGEVGI